MLSLRLVCILVIIQSNLVSSMKIFQDSSDKLVKRKDGLYNRLFKRELHCDIGEFPGEKQCCKKCKKGTYVQSECNDAHGQPVCKVCTERVDFMDEDSGSHECHKCQPCESATGHEVLHYCTVSQDTVCKCKDGFFCFVGLSPNGNCKQCRRCTECDNGLVEPCTPTTDSVCRNISRVHTILWPILAVLAAIIIAVVIYYKKCWKTELQITAPHSLGNGLVDQPLIYPKPLYPPELQNTDLETYLYDLSGIMAEESVLRLVMKTLKPVDRENIQKDYPGDKREQKYELLKKWYNEFGQKGAFQTLLENAAKGEVEKIINLVTESHNNS